MRRLVEPTVLISVVVLSALCTPFLGLEASPESERVPLDITFGTLSFELPPGYQVVEWTYEKITGRAEGLPIQSIFTREDGSRETGSVLPENVGFWASLRPCSDNPDLRALIQEHQPNLDWEGAIFQEGNVNVPGDAGATYPGYYVLIFMDQGIHAQIYGYLMALVEPDYAAVFTVMYPLDWIDYTIEEGTWTFTVDGQSPIAKHKADTAAMVASVRISWQSQSTSDTPTIPAEISLPEEPTSIEVSQNQDEVFIKEPGSDDWKPVSIAGEGISVNAGSTVRTGQASVRLLDLPIQGDQVFLGENTEVHVRERNQLYYRAADLYYEGKYEEAMTAIEEFLTLEPEDRSGQLLLERIKSVLEFIGGIIPTAKSTSDWTEESAGLFYEAADLYFEGKYEEAQKAIKKFLTLEPEDENGQKLLKRIESVLEFIGKKTPYDEAIIQYRRGEWEEARETLKKYLASNPTDQMAEEVLKEIEFKLSMSTFSTKESRDFYYEALREYGVGELEKAVEALRNCLAIDPTNYAALHALGEWEPLKPEEQGIILDVIVGKIRAIIGKLKPESKFEIRTPVGHTGVRGTDFIVDTTQERTEVLVIKGVVELSDLEGQKVVVVSEGKSSVIVKGGLPSEPQRYSNADVYEKYQALFESEEEMEVVIGDIEKVTEDTESGGFPFYLLAIPAVVIVVALILVMRRMRRA